jgi:hypothetical protein
MVKKRRGLADMLRDEVQHLEQSHEETDLQTTDSVSLLNTGNDFFEETESANPLLPDSASLSETDSVSNRETESITLSTSNSVSSTPTESVTSEETESTNLPIYQQMVRKEARLHEVQYDELTRLARDLNRRKRRAGEIITANTLLRVATTLLLQRRAELRGDTEEELLDSLRRPN